MEMLNVNFQKEYKPSSYVAVDEFMILFKGRSAMKQYMALKPKIKHGYKVGSITDSQTGYLCKFDLHQGRTERRPTDMGLCEHVVLSVTEDVVDAVSQVFFDNFFFLKEASPAPLRAKYICLRNVQIQQERSAPRGEG